MARKTVHSPPKRKLKRSTLSSDSLFGFGTQSSSSGSRQLSVPKFTLSQTRKNSASPMQGVIDLTGDDNQDERAQVPVPAMKKARRTSPTPILAPRKAAKGKERSGKEEEERLWVDSHAPVTQETLAVHPKKVEDVRRWLTEALTGGPTGKLRRYRRILVLTGPSGCGKTATLQVLAKELDAEISEWVASSDEFSLSGGDYDYESAITKLVAFLDRAGSYTSLTLGSTSHPPPDSKKPKILLLEDIPTLSHPRTKSALHTALVRFAEANPAPPLVIVISDTGLRADPSQTYSFDRQDVVDARNVLPPALSSSHYVTQVKFNPIAATFMRKALGSIISTRLSLPTTSRSTGVPRETLDALVEASAGDIRSAIMAVQFASVTGSGGGKSKKKGERDAAVKAMFSAVTRREQALALFHLLGRLFYNKRYGDPDEPGEPPETEPYPLPDHLVHFERRSSKVDVVALHADSPVDTSLFSLYVQHNFSQFCTDIDECWGIADALSEADGGMGLLDDTPNTSTSLAQYAFQHVARSALLSLPSPVPRRSQVMRKPAWFASRVAERDADAAVEDAKRWLGAGWDRTSVVLDAGFVLGRLGTRGPPSAHVFSAFRWDTKQSDDVLGEEEAVDEERDDQGVKRLAKVVQADDKGYLSDDDIDEF